MKFFIIFLFSTMINSNVGSLERKKDLIKNEKTFSGPMGMGLSKSYELKKKKFAFTTQLRDKKKLF